MEPDKITTRSNKFSFFFKNINIFKKMNNTDSITTTTIVLKPYFKTYQNLFT